MVIMSKKLMSPSGEPTIAFMLSIIMGVTVLGGRPYASIIWFIFPLCMKSNALKKSMNNSVYSRIFARTPSMIQ